MSEIPTPKPDVHPVERMVYHSKTVTSVVCLRVGPLPLSLRVIITTVDWGPRSLRTSGEIPKGQ